MGCPGCAASACCRAAKATGAGGGVDLATIGRRAIAAGGPLTRFSVLKGAPRTLFCVGAPGPPALMGMDANCLTLTATATRATGCALTKACCGTAEIAPATLRFAYLTLTMFVSLRMMVVL